MPLLAYKEETKIEEDSNWQKQGKDFWEINWDLIYLQQDTVLQLLMLASCVAIFPKAVEKIYEYYNIQQNLAECFLHA